MYIFLMRACFLGHFFHEFNWNWHLDLVHLFVLPCSIYTFIKSLSPSPYEIESYRYVYVVPHNHLCVYHMKIVWNCSQYKWQRSFFSFNYYIWNFALYAVCSYLSQPNWVHTRKNWVIPTMQHVNFVISHGFTRSSQSIYNTHWQNKIDRMRVFLFFKPFL